MRRQRGWVSVSVQTYQSHRTSAQRILQQEYTVNLGLRDSCGLALMRIRARGGVNAGAISPPSVACPVGVRWQR